jgi:dimethylamine/trimethylamine dehydrogenase
LVTPAATVSAWTANTLEALPIARRLAGLGVELLTYTSVRSSAQGSITLVNAITGALTERSAAIVTVTARLPVDGLYTRLAAMKDRWSEAGVASVTRIGDCYAPGTIQAAVYSGHKFARGLDEPTEGDIPRELPRHTQEDQSLSVAASALPKGRIAHTGRSR